MKLHIPTISEVTTERIKVVTAMLGTVEIPSQSTPASLEKCCGALDSAPK